MKYAVSDFHGCYKKYMALMEKLKLSLSDTLYVLGDVTDRGEDGIKILLDMMNRVNVVPILGNHEYMAYGVLKKNNVEITAKNYATHLDKEDVQKCTLWMINGGEPTLRGFSALSPEIREGVLEYLEEFRLYEECEAGGKQFVMVHGGLADFSPEKDLASYCARDLVWERCDYDKVYFPHKYLVTGHTPTASIDPAYDGKIYQKNKY